MTKFRNSQIKNSIASKESINLAKRRKGKKNNSSYHLTPKTRRVNKGRKGGKINFIHMVEGRGLRRSH